MKGDIQGVWQEILADYSTSVFIWQSAVIIVSLFLALSINGLLRSYVMKYAPAHWKVGIEGINRVLFPLTSLILVSLGQIILSHWQHVSLLRLASTLLLAMAAIRLAVYALRYIFSPSGWLRKTESAIATAIWTVIALHLTGFLPELLEALDAANFAVGRTKISLLLVIQVVITVLVTVIAALWFSRILENRLMRNEHLNQNMRVVLGKVVRIVVTVFAVLFAFSAIGLDITLLSVFGGALGVGLGFGLQKIASNFVSGFIILLDDSLHMGDVITVEDHYGVVSDLRSRYLVLRKLDGTEVVIPNETLITSPVVNHTFTNFNARVQMPIQISYESPLELAMQLIKDATKPQPRVLDDPPAEVYIKGFGDNGIDLLLSLWIQDPEEGSASLQSAIYLDIWRAFQANGIEIPYPQRDIRIVGQHALS